MALVAFPAKLPAEHLGVGHESRGLLREQQLRLIIAPRLQAEHTLVGLNHVHSQVSHQSLDARERPRLCVSGILMEEYPSSFNLLLIKLSHELHMADPFGQLASLSVAVRDQRLELAERHTRWATYQH